MTLLEKWMPALTMGLSYQFSPSGHALLFKPLLFEDELVEAIEVYFDDGRDPFQFRHEDMISAIAWASDEEVVYRTAGPPLGTDPAMYWVLSLKGGNTRPIKEADHPMSVVYGGVPGHLSVLAEPKGKPGIFDLDVNTREFRRRTEYDAALETLEVYPMLKHAFCVTRQEAVLVGWKLGDYLPEGVQYTEENSRWSPSLDEAWMQDYTDTRPDGSTVMQRELTAEAKRKTPYRLYLLGANGTCEEIPESHKTSFPCWSPDGTMIAFRRSECNNYPRYRASGSHGGLWVTQREPLGLQIRVGDSSALPEPIAHPSGVLFCQMDNKLHPGEEDTKNIRRPLFRWESFVFRDGEIIPK